MTRVINYGVRRSARQIAKIEARDARYAAMRASAAQESGPIVTCAAETCGQRVECGQIFCKPHWFSLPKRLRTSIWVTFRHRMTREYGALVRKGMDLIDDARRAEKREHSSARAEAILYGAPDLERVLEVQS